MPTSEKILLGDGKNPVRLSFPRLFQAKAFRPDQKARFEATFLLDPSIKSHAATIAQIKAEAKRIAEEQFGPKLPKGILFCWGNGDDKEYDGYAGMFYIASSNQTRPVVQDRDRTPLAEEDGRPYAGCYVVGTITLWVMDNAFGKRINANLRGVQFVKEGDAFGVRPVDAEAEFEALPDDVGGDDGEDDDSADDPLA